MAESIIKGVDVRVSLRFVKFQPELPDVLRDAVAELTQKFRRELDQLVSTLAPIAEADSLINIIRLSFD